MPEKTLIGGRRNHSQYAHLFGEVIRLRGVGKTWDEIAEVLSKSEGQKVPKTSLYGMWKRRNSGAVRIEGIEAIIAGLEKGGQQLRRSAKSEVPRKQIESLPDEWKPRRAIEYADEAGGEKLKKTEAKKKEPSPWDQINENDFIQ